MVDMSDVYRTITYGEYLDLQRRKNGLKYDIKRAMDEIKQWEKELIEIEKDMANFERKYGFEPEPEEEE